MDKFLIDALRDPQDFQLLREICDGIERIELISRKNELPEVPRQAAEVKGSRKVAVLRSEDFEVPW